MEVEHKLQNMGIGYVARKLIDFSIGQAQIKIIQMNVPKLLAF